MNASTVGLGRAKNVFQVHAVDEGGGYRPALGQVMFEQQIPSISMATGEPEEYSELETNE